MHSGELGHAAGVSTDALRFYERSGLLPRPERSQAGYRLYSPEALHRVRMIRGALSVGFSVAELREIFGERDRGGAPCRRVRKLAAEKLVELEAQMRELARLREELRAAIAEWDRALKKTPAGERAGLLERFAGVDRDAGRRRGKIGKEKPRR
jgi:DNA-binding transcriptional MerR regulator